VVVVAGLEQSDRPVLVDDGLGRAVEVDHTLGGAAVDERARVLGGEVLDSTRSEVVLLAVGAEERVDVVEDADGRPVDGVPTHG